jgi:hypothetical protein
MVAASAARRRACKLVTSAPLLIVVLLLAALSSPGQALQTPEQTNILTMDFGEGVVQSCSAQYLYTANSTEVRALATSSSPSAIISNPIIVALNVQ